MTVRELQDLLYLFSQEMEVFVETSDGEYVPAALKDVFVVKYGGENVLVLGADEWNWSGKK